MLSQAHPVLVIAVMILLWVYLMGAVVTFAASAARLVENLAAVRVNPQNQRRARRAMVSAGVLATCWAWPILLALWTASGRSSGSVASRPAG